MIPQNRPQETTGNCQIGKQLMERNTDELWADWITPVTNTWNKYNFLWLDMSLIWTSLKTFSLEHTNNSQSESLHDTFTYDMRHGKTDLKPPLQLIADAVADFCCNLRLSCKGAATLLLSLHWKLIWTRKKNFPMGNSHSKINFSSWVPP